MPHKKDIFFVETKPSGKRQWVLKRSNSDPHHHHHCHHHFHDDVYLSRDELDNMKERERNVRQEIKRLKAENRALSANWQAAHYEQRQLQNIVPQLEEHIRRLVAENQQLKRSINSDHSNASERVRQYRIKYTKAENENEGLRQTIRHLQSEIHDSVDRIRGLIDQVNVYKMDAKKWMKNFEKSEAVYREERQKLRNANHEIAQYIAENDRLQRDIAEQNCILRRCRCRW